MSLTQREAKGFWFHLENIFYKTTFQWVRGDIIGKTNRIERNHTQQIYWVLPATVKAEGASHNQKNLLKT